MIDFHYENVGKNQDIVSVVLSGKLDETTSSYVLGCVEDDILDGRKKLILDCGQVTYISSMGLGTLVRVNSRMKKIGGDVKLASVHGAVAVSVGLHHRTHDHPRSCMFHNCAEVLPQSSQGNLRPCGAGGHAVQSFCSCRHWPRL